MTRTMKIVSERETEGEREEKTKCICISLFVLLAGTLLRTDSFNFLLLAAAVSRDIPHVSFTAFLEMIVDSANTARILITTRGVLDISQWFNTQHNCWRSCRRHCLS